MDYGELLRAPASAFGGARRLGDRIVIVQSSPDGAFRLIVVANPALSIRDFVPYYLLIWVSVVLLCWLGAKYVASPLRGLATVVDRFGRGDLSVRAQSDRGDEIGDLGAFIRCHGQQNRDARDR